MGTTRDVIGLIAGRGAYAAAAALATLSYRGAPPVTAPPADEPALVYSGPVRREAPKVGRNDPCPCGSGRKVKKCHGGA